MTFKEKNDMAKETPKPSAESKPTVIGVVKPVESVFPVNT